LKARRSRFSSTPSGFFNTPKNKQDGGKDREGEIYMTTIYIKNANGQRVLVEVTEEIAEAMTESRREEWRNNAKEQYYRQASLDGMTDKNAKVADSSDNPLDAMVTREERADRSARICAALGSLTAEQKRLVQMLRRGKSETEIAEALSVNKSSVCRMRQRVQKIFLESLKSDGNF
jgi:DNA-binding NarL/FixJ family response regulator